MAAFWEVAARSFDHLFSLSFAYLLYLFISRFGFESGVWFLISPVPVHCFSITFSLLSVKRIELFCQISGNIAG